MGHYTRLTRSWLDVGYTELTSEGVYVAHQPVHGLDGRYCEVNPLIWFARNFQILRFANGISFSSVLDVGGGDGYLCHLFRKLYGAEVTSVDLSPESGKRARDLFGVESIAADAWALPFPDDAFDVVVCSEVLEHVEHPIEALMELDRVAARAVILTSEEFLWSRDRLEEELAHRRDLPHGERNFFHTDDLRLLLGSRVVVVPQFDGLPPNGDGHHDPDERQRADALDWILLATAARTPDEASEPIGAAVCRLQDPGFACEERYAPRALLAAMVAEALPVRPLERRPASPPSVFLGSRTSCPLCLGDLRVAPDALQCAACGRAYAVDDGVPRLYDDHAVKTTRDELPERIARWRGAANAPAILALHERLALPDGNAQMVWDFTRRGDREPWLLRDLVLRPSPRPGAVGDAKPGVALACTSVSEDPWLLSPLLIMPEQRARTLEIKLRLHNPDFPVDAADAQVYWLGKGMRSFTEEASIRFQPINDGELHTYEIPLADHAHWPAGGEGFWLRVDPANGPGEVDIHSLRLV